jgi:hypothetical protein
VVESGSLVGLKGKGNCHLMDFGKAAWSYKQCNSSAGVIATLCSAQYPLAVFHLRGSFRNHAFTKWTMVDFVETRGLLLRGDR